MIVRKRRAGERIRTADLPLTRTMLPSHGSATCTDATRKCHRCTQNRAFSRRSVPRLVPRRHPRRGRAWKLAGLQATPWNVTPWTYRVIVSEYTLPEVPRPRRRYEVTVTLPRPTDVEALLPGGQAAVDIAAAAIAAERLLTAWTCRQSVVSTIVDLPSMADALAAGAQMARVLGGGGDGRASVTAQPIASVHEAD
jgi:hypothetical protein